MSKLALALLVAGTLPLLAQTPVLHIQADQVKAKVSPTFYGLMTEEINHSYDGGLYGELVQNRIFKDVPKAPVHWSTVGGAPGLISLDNTQPINDALTVALKLDAAAATTGKPVGVANDGFWGVPVLPNTTYRASFYARANPGYKGPVTIALESNDGATVFAKADVTGVGDMWKKFDATLTTPDGKPLTGKLVLSTEAPGTLWFDLVSLFPPTTNDRPNGLRPDLMKLLADLKPEFLRLPGGNYLEGDTLNTRFKWEDTLGALEQRPGHPGCWGYRSSDGLGLLEFLEWCEDLHIQPVLAVYAGYSLREQHVEPGPLLEPYVQSALDEIEYVTGDAATTRMGAQRAKDGHPAPFPLTYVEIGNEDWFDQSHSYEGRFAQFAQAIRAKYPALQLIATMKVHHSKPDVEDEHFYPRPGDFYKMATRYDSYPRTGPKIFVGEWATRATCQTADFNAALNDAAWFTGMERNSDLVVLESYAPLFVNINVYAKQWQPNLIGYDALTSFGSPSYWMQKMFADGAGDVVPVSSLSSPPPTLFYSVMKDSAKGVLYVKVVNAAATPQPLHLEVAGASAVDSTGQATVMASTDLAAFNSIAAPQKIVPHAEPLTNAGPAFDHTFPPDSISVLALQTK